MRPRRGYNPKRRIQPAEQLSKLEREKLSKNASYGGNPEHKSRPNDYNLTPIMNPRPGKTLCDKADEFPKRQAERLLCQGLLRGMVSLQIRNGWPQNVWSVLDGEPFEAQLENSERGGYHGYPMPADDDFRQTVLTEWSRRE